MNYLVRKIYFGIIFVLLSATAALPQSASVISRYQGDVYLVRGFSDIFSRGLDQLGEELNIRGIAAKVIRHRAWRAAAVKIYNNQKKFGAVPIVLIGHSLGANAILRIAEFLKERNVQVQYLVTFEPTVRLTVPSNVKIAVNYYLSSSIMGRSLTQEANSRGSFRNVDMAKVDGVGHFNIEKNSKLQQIVLRNTVRYILK